MANECLTLNLLREIDDTNYPLPKDGELRIGIEARGDMTGLSTINLQAKGATNITVYGAKLYSESTGTTEINSFTTVSGANVFYLKATQNVGFLIISDKAQIAMIGTASLNLCVPSNANAPIMVVNLIDLPTVTRIRLGADSIAKGDIKYLSLMPMLEVLSITNAESTIWGSPSANFIYMIQMDLPKSTYGKQAIIPLSRFQSSGSLWGINAGSAYITGDSTVLKGKGNFRLLVINNGNPTINMSDFFAKFSTFQYNSKEGSVTFPTTVNFTEQQMNITVSNIAVPVGDVDRLLNNLNSSFSGSTVLWITISLPKSYRSASSDAAVTSLISKGCVITVNKE